MNLYYLFIIAATLVGFCTLAWLLLAPIWRFLDQEQKVSQEWTKEALARRRRKQQQEDARRGPRDGAASPPSPPGNDDAAEGDAPKKIPPPPRPTPGGDGATAPNK